MYANPIERIPDQIGKPPTPRTGPARGPPAKENAAEPAPD
jgi:hypothetical protein